MTNRRGTWRNILLLLGVCLQFLPFLNGFANPKSEFVLEIDGNSISTAREHLCAIEKKQGNTIGGRAKCWGFDHIEGRTRPPQDIDFVQIVTGFFFSCGIAVDQAVHCWGSMEPKIIPGLYTQITSSADSRFACGVLVDGSINCWGFYDTKLRPPVLPGKRFIQISCSENHCCALDDKGYPVCWGERPFDHIDPPKISYQEYLESKENSGWIMRKEKDEYEEEEEGTAAAAEILSGEGSLPNELSYVQFRQISVGESFSCGITLLGSHLLCWGSPHAHYYQPDIPRQVKGPFRQVSVGASGVCAIHADRVEEEEELESSGGGGVMEVNGSSGALETPVPDTLQCWGRAKSMINKSHFDAWDQVSVGSSYVCGVSMESQVECGGNFPGDDHRDIIIA